MKSILAQEFDLKKPWLILGKGPSFSKIDRIDLTEFNTFGLNHVSSIIPVDIGHFIDLECLSLNLINNSNMVVCPVYPHVYNKCRYIHINEYVDKYTDEVASKIKDKLFLYNCTTHKGTPIVELGPYIRVRHFSAEAAFKILALKDVPKIYSLGIDGGTEYSHYFSHLKALTNGRKAFDYQFEEINNTIKKWDIKWIRL
jgi:hypothetical protein